MRRRFQIGMGVNPSLIINKGIYIQHVDGGLYTKENWSNYLLDIHYIRQYQPIFLPLLFRFFILIPSRAYHTTA